MLNWEKMHRLRATHQVITDRIVWVKIGMGMKFSVPVFIYKARDLLFQRIARSAFVLSITDPLRDLLITRYDRSGINDSAK